MAALPRISSKEEATKALVVVGLLMMREAVPGGASMLYTWTSKRNACTAMTHTQLCMAGPQIYQLYLLY